MSFDSATLTRLAKLAHLRVPPDQAAGLGNEMSAIFSLIDQLQAVDTKGVDPLSHPLSAIEDMTLRLRDDVAAPCEREANLANAPQTENGLFLVPKVIE